jgi:hypothetical protein
MTMGLLVATQEGGNFNLALSDGGNLPVQSTTTVPVPGVPGALSQALWVVDPVNGNDNNPGTLALPVKTVMGGIVPKWGAPDPTFPPSTTSVQIQFVNDETVAQEMIVIRPTMTAIAPVFAITGAYVPVATGTLNAVTAKNRATGQRLASTFTGVSPTAGQLVHNTTHPSRAPLFAVSGGILCQPLSLAPAGLPAHVTSPTEVDTWANGDAVTVERPTKVNIGQVFVTFAGNFNAAGSAQGLLYIQAIEALDNTGSNGNANCIIQTLGGTAEAIDCIIDPLALIESAGGGGLAQIFLTGCFLAGAFGNHFEGVSAMRGGGALTGVAVSGQIGNFSLDVIMGNDLAVSGAGVSMSLGTVYLATALKLGPGGFSGGIGELANDGTGTCALYGPGTIQVRGGGALTKTSSVSTFVGSLLVAGAITIDLSATASQYVVGTGVWTGGITINPTNLDAHGGLINPLSTSRIVTTP